MSFIKWLVADASYGKNSQRLICRDKISTSAGIPPWESPWENPDPSEKLVISTPERTRTFNLLIRSQPEYFKIASNQNIFLSTYSTTYWYLIVDK